MQSGMTTTEKIRRKQDIRRIIDEVRKIPYDNTVKIPILDGLMKMYETPISLDYVPKTGMCIECVHLRANCSRLNFKLMPKHVIMQGVQQVICTGFIHRYRKP